MFVAKILKFTGKAAEAFVRQIPAGKRVFASQGAGCVDGSG